MAGTITDPLPSRPVPAFDPLAAFFWESGADDQLRILRCGGCGFYVHPPSHPCPQCFSAELAPAVVSGYGTAPSPHARSTSSSGSPVSNRDRPNPPAFIDAVGTAMRGRPSWDQYDDLTSMAAGGRRSPVGTQFAST